MHSSPNSHLSSDGNEDFVTILGLAGGAVGTKYDWNLTYSASESLGGRYVSIPQGKVVGGSTKLNGMVFDRGSKSDYDRWETLGTRDGSGRPSCHISKKSVHYPFRQVISPGTNTNERALYRMRSSLPRAILSSPSIMSRTMPRFMALLDTCIPLTHHFSGQQRVRA